MRGHHDKTPRQPMTITPKASPGVPNSTADPQRHIRTDHLLGGRTARGAAVTLVSQVVKFLISLSGTVVLARLLTPEDYGLVGMAAVFIGFIAVFKDFRLSAATVQRTEITHNQVTNLFWINLAIGGVITLVTAAAAPALAWFCGDPRLIAITWLASPSNTRRCFGDKCGSSAWQWLTSAPCSGL